MKVHYFAVNKIRHLEYSFVSVRSLIELGGVSPSDIVLTISPTLHCWTLREFQRRYPIVVRELGLTPNSKFSILNEIFQEYPDEQLIVQLDVDTALTQPRDFLGMFDLRGPDVTGCTYQNPYIVTVFRNRSGSTIQDMRYTIEGPPRKRFEGFIENMFGCTIPVFEDWMTQHGWVYGGIFTVHKRLTQKPVWKKMVALSTFCHCDETAIQLARYAAMHNNEDFGFQPLEIKGFQQVICPKVLNFKDPRGMVHWASDKYRLYTPEYRDLIDEEISKTLKETIL